MAAITRDQVLEKVRKDLAAGGRVDLRDVDLTGADLRNTLLIGADLRNTLLTRADLTDAKLTGVALTGADLTDTWLHGATLAPQQLLDTRGLRPGRGGLPPAIWGNLLPSDPRQRQLVEHLLNDGWGGTLRQAIATVEGLAGR